MKTIFNHFGSKEDLFFDRVGELQESLVRTIVDRPAATTLLAGLPPQEVGLRVAAVVGEAFRRLALAFPDLDTTRRSAGAR